MRHACATLNHQRRTLRTGGWRRLSRGNSFTPPSSTTSTSDAFSVFLDGRTTNTLTLIHPIYRYPSETISSPPRDTRTHPAQAADTAAAHTHTGAPSLSLSPPTTRPLQEIRLLQGYCARINHPIIPPAHLHFTPWCNTIARLLDSIRLPFRPPVRMLYTIQYW